PIETKAGSVHFPEDTNNYFAHTRIEDMDDGETRRVIEVQSDLFQRGRLEDEAKPKGARDYLYETEKMPLSEEDIQARMKEMRESGGYNEARIKAAEDSHREALKLFGDEARQLQKGIKKLEQYSQTWWQRVIREELRKAAVDGKNVLLFPTGETAMKVEKLGVAPDAWVSKSMERHLTDADGVKFSSFNTPLENIKDNLFVGMEVNNRTTQSDWVVTEVIGDGKFKAVKKTVWDDYQKLSSDVAGLNEFQKAFGQKEKTAEEMKADLLNESETFDISGKIDTKNPIYKFYESDVGMYLNRLRKGNIEAYTDPQGVTWLKTAVTQEDLAPVLAYQKAEQIPEEDYQAWLEAGGISDPESNLAAQETVAAYQIENAKHEMGRISPGLAADLDYRRAQAAETFLQADLDEQANKAMAIEQLASDIEFSDPTMNDNYDRFAKETRRKPWMLGSETDVITKKLSLPHLFENESGLYDDDVLEQFKSRFGFEKDLVDIAKKKTATELRIIAKKAAEKYVRDSSVKRSERIKTTIKRINSQPKTTITVDEMKTLQARLQAMASGSKTGFVEGKRLMKDELMTKWRQSETDRLEVVNQLADYMSEYLPTQQRGRFVRAIGKIKDLKGALKLMDQIDRIQETGEKKVAVEELKKEIKRFKKGNPNISLDYVKRIQEILSSYDGAKPTEDTLRKLNAMSSFLDANPDAFITKEMATKLRRLTKTPLAEMTTSQIEEVTSTVKELARLGQLKQNLKNVYEEREWQSNIDALIKSTT
ncbi:MAG: hypothetical protein NUV91_09560, partial [Candidatus Omnitrophica bacterium]|nr:hypothetical protein [Candidatus Omnitrophota bacterium]